jgi:HAE1 family hydrophobic/amphiphilic exporter-1
MARHLIPLLAVPVSLIGTFIIFPLLGFSINTLSLFGLVLAIGLVVDDAIIVVEAVEHHIEQGMSPQDATYKAMEEVASPVIAIALILAAVFIPTAFIPGITGRLYQQFAITIAISVLISAFNALTLSPALASLLLKPKRREERKPESLRPLLQLVQSLLRTHHQQLCLHLRVLLRKSGFSMLIIVGIGACCSSAWGRLACPGFIPTEDQGYAFVNLQLPQTHASLQRTDEAALKSRRRAAKTPASAASSRSTASACSRRRRAPTTAFFFVTLKDWDARKSQGGAVRRHPGQSRTRQLAANPDGIAFSFAPPSIPGLGTSGGVSFVLQDKLRQRRPEPS